MYGVSRSKPQSIGIACAGAPPLADAEEIRRGIERCRWHIKKMSGQGRNCEGALLVLTRLENRLHALITPRSRDRAQAHVMAADGRWQTSMSCHTAR